jgi:hypothetical protein
MSLAVPFDLTIFLIGTFAAAFVTGLAGFAFGMVAAGIWLFALTPVQTTTSNWHRLCIRGRVSEYC